MATKIVTKNSSTASAVPTASDLVQGELAVNVADKRLFTEDNGGAIVELGTNPSGNVTFQDNGKAIFGAGSDLQIYHDGDTSYISHNTTGTDLVIEATSPGDDVIVRAADDLNFRVNGNENGIVVVGEGATSLYHANSQKLATTSTGIDVTGTATMDAATVQTTGSTTAVLTLNNADGNGTLSQINLGYTADPDHGNISYTGDMIFTAGAAERMRIDASGNVGIGKTPNTNFGGYVLQLNGGAQTFMSFGNSTTGTTLSDGLVIGCDSGGADIYQREAQPLRFHTSNTERMRIDSSGRVGIGTSSPSAPLDVVSSSGSVGAYIRGRSSDNIGSVYFTSNASAATEYGFVQGRSSDLRIQGFNNGLILQPNGGNVGIGTSSPAYKLDLNGDMRFTSSSALFWGDTNVYEGRTGSDRYWVTGGSERMRIDASGNLLVGTTDSNVYNDASGTGTVVQSNGIMQLAANNGTPLYANRQGTDGDIIDFRKSGTAVGSIGSFAKR